MYREPSSNDYKRMAVHRQIKEIAEPYIWRTCNPIKIGCEDKVYQAAMEAGKGFSYSKAKNYDTYGIILDILTEAKKICDRGGGHVKFVSPDAEGRLSPYSHRVIRERRKKDELLY